MITKTIVLLIAAFVCVGLLIGRRPAPQQQPGMLKSPAEVPLDPPAPVDGFIQAVDAKPAPGLADGTWLNTKPLAAADLHGHVVLIEFWTFGCYNCVNTLPAMKRFHTDYASKGLTLIGVETPELKYEYDPENLAAAIKKRDIEYPVLTDYDYKSWNAFKVEAWPTIFILDKAGRIRYSHIGEGAYDDQEAVIKLLLAEKGG